LAAGQILKLAKTHAIVFFWLCKKPLQLAPFNKEKQSGNHDSVQRDADARRNVSYSKPVKFW